MFESGETQAMMADMVGRLLARENEFEARRHRLSAEQPDRLHLWPMLAEQGVIGALAVEEAGGFGGTARDLATLMAQAGTWLAVEPLLQTALAAHVLSGLPEEAPLLEQMLAGQAIALLAHGEGGDPLAQPAAHMGKNGGEWRVSGTKALVRGGDVATHFLVTAIHDGRTALCLVAANAPGLRIDTTRLIDGSGGATLHLDNTPAGLLLGHAGSLVERLLTLHLIGLCAESAAIMRAANEQTFAYLATRKQFGTPLASFQALQHRAADMFIAAEEARVLTDRLVTLFDTDPAQALPLAAAAKAAIDGLARRVAHEAVQLHGGMGVSDELVVSHYFKRLAAIRAEAACADDLYAWLAARGSPIPLGDHEEAELAAFRGEVREFVRTALPADLAAKGRLGLEIAKADYVGWQKILSDKGWFASAWPREHGGGGWDIHRQLVLLQEAALGDAPLIIPYGVSMVGPVLYTFGDEAQRTRHLPGILSSDVWWCQGYSEPNSGSDLASLKTTAVRDGDDYIVNGAKMWTTEAHWADWMHCLVRTDREVKAQAGISFLLIDMTSPGIDIRPIVTIDGQHHTNQIFLDNVRVPAANLVGAEGQGWTIAKFLLANERVAIADTGPKMRLLAQLRERLATAREAGSLSAASLDAITGRIVVAETELAMLIAMEDHYVAQWAAGGAKTGPEASILKVRGTEVLQSLCEIGLMLEGPLAAVHDPHDLHLAPGSEPGAFAQASMSAHRYLYSRCWSIFGGTNEIQRNIIAGSILR
ncbi:MULTISPECIES: acyl-CoA dehydrogenase family protein [unclassified Novosphingobium]|uniref:acyl-CoA dehydrogenase family protein n=1 Tax=unclassified Novosphingobium TaxID=2644732 RepID=UPI00190F2803|nr:MULTISPECIES: acyl-CoA dehydrogenase family protein [unclassified Novosphingobium]